jgi:hypothetical protein
MSNRRAFLKGLFASAAATPLLKFAATITDNAIVQPTRGVGRWLRPTPLRNSGAWNPQYQTYDEAKAASDKISAEILRTLRP